MGTSSSYGGPGDKTPLLPSWALPQDGEGSGEDPEGEKPDEGDSDSDSDNAGDGDGDGTDASGDGADGQGGTDDAGSPQSAARQPERWRSAKTQLGKAITSRSGKSGYGRAASSYVKALGGSGRAATSSRSSKAATRALGGFLSDVRNHGLNTALERIGLKSVIGRDIHTVFAAVVDAIAPEGKSREEAAAREAVCETLADLFGEHVAAYPTGNSLQEAMTSDGIKEAIEASVVASAFNRWLEDLARQIETKAISAAEALRVERDIHKYMVETVKLDFAQVDPLTLNWHTDGRKLIDGLYADAYRMLENAK